MPDFGRFSASDATQLPDQQCDTVLDRMVPPARQPHADDNEIERLEMDLDARNETNYWIIVSGADNFAKSRELGFTVQGMKSRHRKKAEKMHAGDKIAYYITGKKMFAGTATITSDYFESHEPIWKSKDPKKDAEDYPFRVAIEPDLILDEDHWIDAERLARQMEYASKWPAKNWTLAFQGNVHNVPQGDFDLIRAAIESETEKTGG